MATKVHIFSVWLQEFSSAKKADAGQYVCEAVNEAGPSQRCKAARMEVRKCPVSFIG